MVHRVRIRLSATRATGVLALMAVLAGCGSTLKGGQAANGAQQASSSMSCPATVLDALGKVLRRVYHEGISSERTGAARYLIAASVPLREAVIKGDATAATAAARALVANGHMTNLRVMSGPRILADVGGPALTPLRGTLVGPGGVPIGSYVTSVWSDSGFVQEGDGVAEGLVALRAKGRSIGGSFALAPGPLASRGTLTHGHDLYQYTSFAAEAFPAGALRIYLLRPVSSTTALCGHSGEDTTVNTISRVASRIYAAEAGGRTLTQVQRVQRDQPLLSAVARRDPVATKLAVEGLLNQHIVRLRVSAAGKLLADVGGPYVLAPVSGQLRLAGRTIGSFVLSIQDDEGYLRLAKRLAGVKVLMYMNPTHPKLVKNSLGAAPGTVPDSGRYQNLGRHFRVFTIHAKAFPTGPLLIRVLIPIPYLYQ